MNWLQKIEFLIKEKERVGYGGPYRIDIVPEENTWDEGELELIVKDYPWIPKTYIEFIRKYNTIGIAWLVFYGSIHRKSLALSEQIPYWYEEGLPRDYFPFGKGPGGELYVFNKAGEVIEFPPDDYDFERPEKLAKSLEDFIDNDVLGKRYIKFSNLEGDTFYEFMKLQGWVD